jgi:hypothetical protein
MPRLPGLLSEEWQRLREYGRKREVAEILKELL